MRPFVPPGLPTHDELPRIGDIRGADVRHFESIIQVWEASVRATHDFLAEEDRLFYQSFLPTALAEINVFFLPGREGSPVGFIGIGGDKIEMLFIHPAHRGKGLGKCLIDFAILKHQACRVDVNEQNGPALAFYRKRGFEVVGRDAEDGYGKPYPILHLRLKA